MYDWQCGMSVRATEAYDAGEKPLSKITKVDLARAGLPDMGLAFAKFLASESSEDLFDFQDQPIWDNSSSHHTSSYYSETKFYRAEDLAIAWNDLEPEEQGKLVEEYERQRQWRDYVGNREGRDMTETMTKTQAIKTARDEVGELFRTGESWSYATWDREFNAWEESGEADFWNARFSRSEALIRKANEALGYGRDIYGGEQNVQYDGGSWMDYVGK